MKTILELKNHLKAEASAIRELKKLRKTMEGGYVPELFNTKYLYRVYHIAYSLLRGRTMEEIENNRKKGVLVNYTELRLQKDLERVLEDFR